MIESETLYSADDVDDDDDNDDVGDGNGVVHSDDDYMCGAFVCTMLSITKL